MASDQSVLGRCAVLVVATRGAGGPGEVRVGIRGGSETYLAYSDDALPRGTTVLIVGKRGPRAVEVVAWCDPAVETLD